MVDQGELEKKLDVGLSEEEIKKYGFGNEKNLEEVVRDHKHTPTWKKILNYAIGIGAMAASYAIIGPIGPGAALLGLINDYVNCKIRKRDFPSRQFRNIALTWALFAIPGVYAYKFMNSVVDVKTTSGFIKRGIMELFGFLPAFGIVTNAMSYPIENLKFKGLYNVSLKKVWWKNYKAALKYFSIPEMLIARYMPPLMQFPLLLGLRTLWGVTFGSRYVRMVDPYLYEHKKIQGKNIYEWGKQFGIIPGEGRGKPVHVDKPEEYKKQKKSLADKVKNKLSYLNPFNNYQLQPALAYDYHR